MATEIVTTARVEKGRLRVRNWERIQARLARCRDGEFIVTIQRKHATRSLNQNAWYWAGIIEPISEHTGFTPDETHELMKAMFIPKRLAVANGNGEVVGEYVIGGSTTKLNKLDFGDYCEAIRRWAAETLQVDIPDPREVAA